MIEWVLTVALAVLLNGQQGWIPVELEGRVVYVSVEECAAAGKLYKSSDVRMIVRVRCTSRERPNTVPMPPFSKPEVREIE